MDREKAIKILTLFREEWDRHSKTPNAKALDMAIEALQEPEIVRCKDCKLRKTEECAMQYECDCGEQHSWENDNDYCSWGIKAGEQNG